ncbi:VanZ family protein [Actinotalea ferrariae]|uniref:VanZ family protein n=1 Tax=Actinotalea ferrariae TaxID=1386098 RepID=UPI0027DEF62E|nr:VanZ family protein [Actinotalea ferrariae]
MTTRSPWWTGRRPVRLLLAVYLLAVLRITQWPSFAEPGAFTGLAEVLAWLHARGLPTAVDVALVEALANVAMLVPFGVLVPLAGLRRTWLAVPLGCAFSIAIELAQLAFWPTRVATVQDVVMNTLGAAVGVGLLTLGRRYAAHVSTPEAGGAPRPGALRTLVRPSTLEPVHLDLRRVFLVGIGAWGVALVVVGVLAASGRAATTDVVTCAAGLALGGLALLWERRHRAQADAPPPG